MKRLLTVLLALALVACGSGNGDDKDALSDADLTPMDGTGDIPENDSEGGDIVDPGDAVDDGMETGDSVADVVSPEGEFELFTTAPSGDLRAIWGSAKRLYAVGENGVILRQQGTTWTPMKSPTTNTLLAIFGEDDDNVYAAGQEGTLLHWNGFTWSEVDTGLDLDLSELNLNGLWGAEGQFYVVGDKGTILHYFEGKWKEDDSLSSYNLMDIWGVSLTDIYVAAAGGTVLRKIGGAWSSQQVTQGSIIINGIQALSAKAIFGGGSKGGIVAHDTAGWSPKLSNDAYERTLQDVWAFDEDDVWMVGIDGALIHLEATKWNTQEWGDSFYANHSFYGLWGRQVDGEQTAWTVGEKGALVRFDGDAWSDQPTSAAVDFNDIDGTTWETPLAVGGDGALLRFDGADWYGLDRVSDAALTGIATNETTTVVVGKAGTVLTVEDDMPNLVDTDFTTDLNGVCAGDEFVAVGAQGKMYVSADGEAWTETGGGVFAELKDCAVGNDGVVWVVGSQGTIVRVENGASQTVPVATGANFTRISAAPDGTLYVVGDNGILLTNSGDGWNKAYEESGVFLSGVIAFDDIVYMVGWKGRVLSYHPGSQTVSEVDAPASGVLLQIWGPDADHLLVVGKNGKMLRYVAQ